MDTIQIKNPVVTHKTKHDVRYLKPGDLQPGDTIEGTYLYTQKNMGNFEGEGYLIDPIGYTGEYVCLLSCASLKWQMQHVKPLEILKITFTGITPPEENQKYPKYNFEVEYF